MPLVRGRFIPEIESTGRAKRTLDVLLYLEKVDDSTLVFLDELEQLRVYLASFPSPVCSVRLLVPGDQPDTLRALETIKIEALPIALSSGAEPMPNDVAGSLTDPLEKLLATALDHDADCVATNNSDLLPYVEEFGKAGVLLTSIDFLLCYAEIFVRGHDVPWAFANKVWFDPWIGFYQLSEQWTFRPGIDFLTLCQTRGVNREAVELCRSLVFNRLGDLCFTRDRLCFYEMQQAAAKRAKWKRQRFSAEVAYYLNFFYVLLYGAFDHAGVLVNALLNLGLNERYVSARNPEFLKALGAKSQGVQAVFEKPTHVTFIRRVAAVRHTAAHRGVLTPTKVVRDLDHPPTNEELDQDIRESGLDYLMRHYPTGPGRDAFQEMLRVNARAARYERETLMEDVVLIETASGHGFIHPLNDTWWNFKSCMSFLNDVFSACSTALK